VAGRWQGGPTGRQAGKNQRRPTRLPVSLP